MANLSEDIQSAGSDTRPPMLDRSDFESWQQRIRLYCMGKDNWENIIKSVDEGPFKMGKFRETLVEGAKGALHLGPERDRVFADLTPEENDRYKANIRPTNILLQGLPKDIYTLINHYTDAKDIWDNVKMLLEGSELTKDELKLNRGLKASNYDKLYAYLSQHEAHANEKKMMLERYSQHAIDPLSLVSNVSPQQTSSNTRNQATVQNGRVVVQNVQGRQNRVQRNNARGAVATGNGGVQNRVGNANPGQGKPIMCYNCNGIRHMSRNCTQPKRPHNSKYFKDKMLLMQA
ncbi:integrase, catalytic region, zinc finger, CCHC-type containing protein [Tanacetum coccineum]